MVLITFQGSGLETVTPFCDFLETSNFQNKSTPEGLFATQGINVAFNAFMTAIAQVDYDAIFGGGGDDDPTDAVRLLSSSGSTDPELNHDGFCSTLGRGSIVPSSGFTRSRIQTTR